MSKVPFQKNKPYKVVDSIFYIYISIYLCRKTKKYKFNYTFVSIYFISYITYNP